jgi:hypothetical protein
MTDATPVDARFDGFPGFTQGGWLAGQVASLLGPEVEVRLLRPFRSGRTLLVERVDGGARALSDGVVVAEGRAWSEQVMAPAMPRVDEVLRASEGYPGLRDHPFPSCYCCGPERAEGDGLRIFPGRLEPGVLAAPFTPRASHCDARGRATVETLWSATDCPALWALMHAEPAGTGRCVVTGTLALRRLGPVVQDEPHVVLSWKTGESGRRLQAAVALFAADGSLRAVGSQVAVLAPKGVPLRWAAS